MLETKDAVSLIITLGDDVWKVWGYLVTVNIALLGWLIQRHGLRNIVEKVVATISYSVFVVVIIQALDTAYDKLDKAANELAYPYVSKTKDISKVAPGGIVAEFLGKSPLYCAELPEKLTGGKCQKYSENAKKAAWHVLLGWLFNIILFWANWRRVAVRAKAFGAWFRRKAAQQQEQE